MRGRRAAVRLRAGGLAALAPGGAAALVAAIAFALLASSALAWSAAEGERELAAIEARWRTLSSAPKRDAAALADLDARALALAKSASAALGAMREQAADRDADMAAVVASPEWRSTEELLLKLRFRIAGIDLERALAGDPDRARLARDAAKGFSDFADAPDPALAAEARYGRGLARIASGERAAGLEDLRAAASDASVAPRARIALAEALAQGGERGQALDVVTRQLAAGGMPRDLELRAKLLRLQLLLEATPAASTKGESAKGTGAAASPATGQSSPADAQIGALASSLLAAGEPWRGATLALFRGREDRLPTGADADAALLRARADALARRGDATGALAAYHQVVERDAAHPDPVALEGIARAAVALGAWSDARAALDRLRALGRPWNRDLALLDLRTAYGEWQAEATPERSAALAKAAEALAKASGATADDRAEAAFRAAEAARAAGDLDRAIAGFQAIDAPSWRVAAGTAALQSRAVRSVRDPAREPRAALLRDLAAWMARRDLPDDARATAIAVDGTLRTATAAPNGPAREAAVGAPDGGLDPGEQRAALARLREFPSRYPSASALVPAVLRARALLELELGDRPDPAMLDVLPETRRPDVAGQIAGDLAQVAEVDARRAGAAPAGAAADRTLGRARRAVVAAAAFARRATAEQADRTRGQLADAALAVGEPAVAAELYRAEAERKPDSLAALRGLAVAAQASGDAATARDAWQRLAARPEVPDALREEARRNLGR